MKSRHEKKTILIVVEGYAEEALMAYLKSQFHQRQAGFTLHIKNARGKGALNVIRYAVRLHKQFEYSATHVLFDTDKDWGAAAKALIKENHLVALPCEPCLEAELLRLLNEHVEGTTEQIKRRFLSRVGCEAHKINDYGSLLPVELIYKCMPSNAWVMKIVNLLSVTPR